MILTCICNSSPDMSTKVINVPAFIAWDVLLYVLSVISVRIRQAMIEWLICYSQDEAYSIRRTKYEQQTYRYRPHF